jgi:glucose/arabinose dehydrogenase
VVLEAGVRNYKVGAEVDTKQSYRKSSVSTQTSFSPKSLKGLAAVVALGLIALEAHAKFPDANPHPDYNLQQLDLGGSYKAMGLDFLSDGRLVIGTIDDIGSGSVPAANDNHKILVVSNLSAAKPTVKEVSNTWHQISGIVVANNKIYVSDRDAFYQILNYENPTNLANNRKKIIDYPKVDPNSFGNWHQWIFTPMYYNGTFYAPYSGSIVMGGPSDTKPTSEFSGALLKWDTLGTKLEKYAGGFRSPNGANISPTGEMFVADNQGSWLPSSTFMFMKPDKFYGHSNTTTAKPNQKNWAEDLPYEKPTAWLDHKVVASSPGQPLYMRSGPYQGDWIIGDAGEVSGLTRIALDKVGDSYNGSIFWFSGGTGNAALNRLAWGPDGSIYIGTCGPGGNWSQSGAAKPFYRLTPKGSTNSLFEMRKVSSVSDGLEIEFSQPVNKSTATAGNFAVKQWNYVRQQGYGLGKGTAEPRTVSGVDISDDGKRVHLTISGMKTDYTALITLSNMNSDAGKSLYHNEAWFTLNVQSPRLFSKTATGLIAARKADFLHDLVQTRRIGPGNLEVTLGGNGNNAFGKFGSASETGFTATLLSLDGHKLAESNSNGGSRTSLQTQGTAHFGLVILEVRQGSEVARMPVAI